jgi:hypothetical protein
MSYIELADTAVKIGLGAFIAGAFALLSSRRQHIHELDRERMKRRERVLGKTAEEFELAYQALSAKYERVLVASTRLRGSSIVSIFCIGIAQPAMSTTRRFP